MIDLHSQAGSKNFMKGRNRKGGNRGCFKKRLGEIVKVKEKVGNWSREAGSERGGELEHGKKSVHCTTVSVAGGGKCVELS